MKLQHGFAAFALSFLLLTPSFASSPTELVERTAIQLVESVEANAESPEALVKEVGEVLDPVVDFVRIARGVMGKTHFGAASNDQRSRFAGVFRDSLVETLAQALKSYRNVTIEVSAGKGDGVKRQSVLVNARQSDGNAVNIIFSMGAADGDWKVRNLTFDGVNMGLSFRNQFNGAMSASGGDIDAVIDEWAVLEDT